MSDREILEEARALIEAKKYREARLILQDIPNNPTAAKWIAKLDDMPLAATSLRENPPSSLRNAKPLPEPDTFSTAQYMSPTPAAGAQNLPMQILRVAIGVFVAAVLIYVFRDEGGPIMDLLSAVNPPQTYTDERITLTHSSGWQKQDLSTHGWCRGVENECMYFIKHSPNVGLLFTFTPLSDRYSADEFADFNWENDREDTVFVKRNRHLQNITLAGFPAVAQMYTLTEHDENGGEFYMVDIYAADGLNGYIINVFANTACNLNSRIAEVNEVLSTLRISSPYGTVSADGYSPASPVALTIPACG